MTDPATRQNPTWLRPSAVIAGRLLVIGLAGVGLTWLVMQVTVVAVAAFVAFAQAALLWPVVRRLRQVLPKALAAILAMTGYLAIFGALTWVIIAEVITTWPDLVDAVVGGARSLNTWGAERGIEIPTDLAAQLESQLRERTGTIASAAGSAALSTLSALGALATTLGLAAFLTIFALTTGPDLWRTIRTAFADEHRPAADSAMRAAVSTARNWMWASTVTGLVDGLFIGLGMHLLGIPLAVPIGMLTFVLGYIPMVGATLAGLLAILVALFFNGPVTALWTLVLVLAVQQIEGNVLSPLLLSRAMDFNPIITLLLASLGGTAFGIVGLFLAVPLAGVVAAAVNGARHPTSPPDDPDAPDDPDDPEPAGNPGTGTRADHEDNPAPPGELSESRPEP